MTSQTPKACTRIAMAAAFVLAITAACGDDTQGHALADTIEKLGGAAIDRADFRPGNLLDPAEVYVWFADSVDAPEALEVWCTAVEPARERARSQIDVSMWLANGDFVDSPDRC
jgi:hypothetical protein